MSLINRAIYLQSILDKFNTKVQPLIDQYELVNQILPDKLEEINSKYQSMIIDVSNQSSGSESDKVNKINKLNEKLQLELESYTTKIDNIKVNLRGNVTSMIEKSVEEVDGVSAEVTESEGTLSVIPIADETNSVTDFVKNSMTSEETKVVVNTTVTGPVNSYGALLPGAIGTQPNAKITTT